MIVVLSELIEDEQMRRRIEQRVMLMLTVELDEPRREILESARRHQLAVDERTASPLRRNLPSDEEFLAAAFEDRFDGREIFAGSHQVARCAAAEQQADGFHQN